MRAVLCSKTDAALLGFLAIGLTMGCQREPAAQEGVVQLEKAFPNGGNNESIQIAIAAAKANDPATGVIALQSAKRTLGLTAEQLMSVEQASQALTADLTRRADAGDAKAKAALELIARARSE